MGAAEFTVLHGDHFIQPFVVTLDQGRTLDGSESWRGGVRKTKDGPLLISFSSGNGTIAVDSGTKQPSFVFTPASFALIAFLDDDYVYDLEMTKAGRIETYAVDTLNVTGDVVR